MNTFLFLCSLVILGTTLHTAEPNDDDKWNNPTSHSYDSTQSLTDDPRSNDTKTSPWKSTASPIPVFQSQSTQPSDTTTTKSVTAMERYTPHIVAGGMILLCFILLISTLMLAFKVCRLNRRIKELSSDADLVVTTEYVVAKGKPEKDVEETTVLMSDLSQTKEEMGNGSTKEEGENTMGEDGDKNKTEEAAATPAAAAESSSSSKGPEETSESPSAEATAASNSEGPGEPKDVV